MNLHLKQQKMRDNLPSFQRRRRIGNAETKANEWITGPFVSTNLQQIPPIDLKEAALPSACGWNLGNISNTAVCSGFAGGCLGCFIRVCVERSKIRTLDQSDQRACAPRIGPQPLDSFLSDLPLGPFYHLFDSWILSFQSPSSFNAISLGCKCRWDKARRSQRPRTTWGVFFGFPCPHLSICFKAGDQKE